MRVIPYNRCVTDLGGRSPTEFLRLVSSVFHIKDHCTGSSIRSNSGNISSDSSDSDCSSSGSIGSSKSSSSDSRDSSDSISNHRSKNRNSTSKYERRSQDVAALNELSSRRRGGGTVSLTESSLPIWPFHESQLMPPKCNGYEKRNNKDEMFDCLETAPCSSTDSDSLDSFDQYDVERSEHSADVESPPYHTSNKRLDSLERSVLKGNRSAAAAPVDQKSRALRTHIAQQQDSCEGVAIESKCNNDVQQQHLIMMYFQGRWLDLVPLDAVAEDDSDPLSSLDIQV